MALQIFGVATEVVSLGALLPFLAVLTDAKEYFHHPKVQVLVQFAGISDELELIVVFSIGFAAAFTLASGMRLFTMWVQARLAAAIGSDLSAELYRRTLYQRYEHFTQAHSGRLISTVTNDFNSAASVVLSSLMIVTQGLAIVAIVSAIFAYDPTVAITMTGVTGLAYLLVMRLNKRQLVQTGRIRSETYAGIVRVLQESFGGIRDVLLGRKQQTFIKRYAALDRSFRRSSAHAQVIRTAPRYVLEAIGVVVLTAVAASLAYLRTDIFSVLPVVGAIAMAANRLLPAMQQVYASYGALQGVHVSLRRTLASLALPLDPVTTAPVGGSLAPRRTVKLEDIWFRYAAVSAETPNQDWVLRGVTLEIPINKTIALVGVTGGGKSTIADVLLGLLRPAHGRILLDGVPLDDVQLSAWRQAVASVPQNIFLSDATVNENIAFGVPVEEIDRERVRQAAKTARVAEFIEDRSECYDEVIGEHGIRLSGGQRQRIGIARALYRSASVIVFDEATSALDNATEQAVMRALNDLKGQATIVLIAHRLSTVRNAGIIFEVELGQVVAQGNYEELLAKSASFRRMVSAAEHGFEHGSNDAVII